VAEGTDKYSAVYSLAEVDPAFHGGTVIVADRMDGQPLGAKDGPSSWSTRKTSGQIAGYATWRPFN
jgi:hypothetical protein